KLNLQQSALLAGLVQSPGAYDPTVHPAAAHARRDVVLAQMLRYHFISQQDYDAAVTSPVALDVHVQGNGCEASRYPYFCDYVENVIKTSPAFGPSPPAQELPGARRPHHPYDARAAGAEGGRRRVAQVRARPRAIRRRRGGSRRRAWHRQG